MQADWSTRSGAILQHGKSRILWLGGWDRTRAECGWGGSRQRLTLYETLTRSTLWRSQTDQKIHTVPGADDEALDTSS